MAIRNIEVAPVKFRNKVVGYSVSGIYRDCTDSLWETFTHHAIFRTEERAQAFLERILNSSTRYNMKHWNVGYSWDGVYSVL